MDVKSPIPTSPTTNPRRYTTPTTVAVVRYLFTSAFVFIVLSPLCCIWNKNSYVQCLSALYSIPLDENRLSEQLVLIYGLTYGASPWSGFTGLTETSAIPRSRTFFSNPYRED